VKGVAQVLLVTGLVMGGTACGTLHSLTHYYEEPDDTGSVTDDTGPLVDTDTGPWWDTGPDTGPGGGTDTGGSGSATTMCEDTCLFAYDGECDDGGPDADWSVCDLGTDCADCGPREVVTGGGLCDDTCFFSADGYCDDGGPGADYSFCALGTDCTDCGPR
jgi:hypothetical protein